ncbi:hypothetical protein QE390_003466 [Siphonobacter sp. SORGH_AS 1065]|nr:hypothetical protein [Siphonobacter sp. SORGH_AS_1065]
MSNALIYLTFSEYLKNHVFHLRKFITKTRFKILPFDLIAIFQYKTK